MKLVDQLRRAIFYPLGLDIVRFPSGVLKRRLELLEKYDINLVLDVGANSGQYATQLRNIGYKNDIISFEPLKTAYNQLETKSKKDDDWICIHSAMGDFDGKAEINIANNSTSSSLLSMKSSHIEANPNSKFIDRETIRIMKLDTYLDNENFAKKKIFLKLDVQGFEKNVFQGAKKSLSSITGVQIEMSFEELYESESLFEEMKQYIENQGFELCSLEPSGFAKKNGKLLQVDGIFFRTFQ